MIQFECPRHPNPYVLSISWVAWIPFPNMDETEGFQCLGHSKWTNCSPLSQFCSEIFPTFSLSYWEANSYYPRGLIMGEENSPNVPYGIQTGPFAACWEFLWGNQPISSVWGVHILPYTSSLLTCASRSLTVTIARPAPRLDLIEKAAESAILDYWSPFNITSNNAEINPGSGETPCRWSNYDVVWQLANNFCMSRLFVFQI